MKVFVNLVKVFFVTLVLASCSTVKVTDAWKDSRIKDIKGGKVLVVFRTKDQVARQRFEKDIAAQIKLQGPEFEVLPSYVEYAEADPEEKQTPEQVEELKRELNALGITVAVVTTVKSVKENVVTNVTHDPSPYPHYNYGYYSGYYGMGYYHHMNMAYATPRHSSAITTTEKEYIVETLLYDLTLPDSEQLLSVVTSMVDNPQSIVTTSDDFSKAVVKHLFKN